MKHLRTITFLAAVSALTPLAAKDLLAELLAPLPETEARATADAAVQAPAEAVPAAQATKAAHLVTQTEMVERLRAALAAQFAPEGQLTITPALAWKAVRVTDADWVPQIVRVPNQELSAHTSVTFRIIANGDSVGEYNMTFNCTLRREVLVARRQMNRGDALRDADFEVQTRDVLDAQQPMVYAGTDVSGHACKVSLKPGQALLWRDIAVRPLVQRGQVVEAIAASGSLRICVKAMVLEDGCAGDTIAVRNITSNKDIKARVLDENSVQVYF
jgi:flagella basal body P-ring formation protein FlgA